MALEELCFKHDNSISKGGTTRTKKHNEYDPLSKKRRFEYSCPYGGVYKKAAHGHQKTAQRASHSQKTGCRFQAMTRRLSEGQWKVQFAREDQGEGALRNQRNHKPTPNFHGFESYRRWWRKTLCGEGVVEEWVGRLPTIARLTASKFNSFFRVEAELEKDINDDTDIPQPQANQPSNLPHSLALLVNPPTPPRIEVPRPPPVDNDLSQKLNLVHSKVQAAETSIKLEKKACQDEEQKTKMRLTQLDQESVELERQMQALDEKRAAFQQQKTAMAQEQTHHEQ